MGEQGIIELPDAEKTKDSNDALFVDITGGNEKHRVGMLGGKGPANFANKVTVGGLDFSLKFGSKEHPLPFSVKLNDFIAEKYPGTINRII